jgi:hypothetical protein
MAYSIMAWAVHHFNAWSHNGLDYFPVGTIMDAPEAENGQGFEMCSGGCHDDITYIRACLGPPVMLDSSSICLGRSLVVPVFLLNPDESTCSDTFTQ